MIKKIILFSLLFLPTLALADNVLRNESLDTIYGTEDQVGQVKAVDRYGRLLVSPGPATDPIQASTATLSNVTASASSVTVLAANTDRISLIIVNDADKAVYLKFGATASTTSFTYKLNAGDTLELDDASIYTGIIDGIWDASPTGAARVTEID